MTLPGKATAALALVSMITLASFLVPGFSGYRSAQKTMEMPVTHEAIDGYYVGAAVQYSFIYELMFVGVVANALALVASLVRRKLVRIPIVVCLIGFSALAGFVGYRTHAVILTAAAVTTLVLFFFSR